MAELRDWQARSQDHGALPEKFRDLDWLRENLRQLENVPTDRMWDLIRDRIALDIQNEQQRTPGHLRRLRQWVSYAAAVLVLIIGWLAYKHYSTGQQKGGELPMPIVAKSSGPITGNHQVLLTLADGTVVPLDQVPNGKVAETADFILTKTDSDRLEYTLKPGVNETAINSRVTTGHTSPFHLVFPDGSEAMLSYGSSLSTSFHGGERELALTGEALFETVKNSHQPFTVVTKKTRVEVLGTRFDVSDYDDESGAVSLFSGAVKVTHKGESKLLKPAEQALVGKEGVEVRRMGDSLSVLSWASKDPYFHFENAELNAVIQRIARWHQVKIYNPDDVKGAPITGIFRQKESLEAILGMIDRVERGYAFLKRKGDTILVSPAMAAR